MHSKMRTVDARGRVTDTPLMHGPRGNYQALRIARAYILSASQSEQIRQLALTIVENVRGHDVEGELDALYRYCRDAITYRHDPRGQERVQNPFFTLKTRAGDCLDKVILFCALAASLGYLTRFVLLMQRQTKDDSFGHIYAQGKTPDGWKSYDPTPEEVDAGWKGYGIKEQAVNIFTPAEASQLSGWLSKLVGIGGVLAAPFTGGASLFVTAGTGVASGLIGQQEAKGAALKQAGADFENQAAALASLFRSLDSQPTITQAQYDQAAQGYAALEQFAQQAGPQVKFIAQKWADDNYGPSFQRQLTKLRAKVKGASSSGASSSGASPLLLLAAAGGALYFLSRGSGNG